MNKLSGDLAELAPASDPRPGDSPGTKAPLWQPAGWIPGPTGSVRATVFAGTGVGVLLFVIATRIRRRATH